MYATFAPYNAGVRHLRLLQQRLRNLPRPGLLGTMVVFVEAMLIAVVLGAVLAYERTVESRTGSRDTINAIDASLIALLDAESGQRGFVITGDEVFLEPYNEALERLDELLRTIGEAVSDDPEQRAYFDHMQPFIDAKLDEMEETIDLRKAGEIQRAALRVQAGSGRIAMDAIRSDLASIRAIESGKLQDRLDRTAILGQFIAVSSIVLAIVTLGIAGWLIYALARRQDAQALRATAAAKDEFVGFVSHEVRSPLAVISGNARLLESDSLSPAERTEALAEITASSDRLDDIVDTLLSLSKAESGVALAVEPILLHRIAQSARRHHRARFPEREVAVNAEPSMPPALGDRGAVEQVLMNLLSNAEKYGDGQAPIEIFVESVGADARVSVVNRGERLSTQELDHVFEPFFRSPASSAAAPGVGLGLTVCHRLIAAQGGRMNAEAASGGGAAFSFRLPLAPVDEDGQ